MKRGKKTIIAQFDQDVISHGGYLYSERPSKSSLLANNRLTDVTLALVDLRGKAVIDVGCGDGIYTEKLYRLGKPRLMVGIDAAGEAVAKAKRNYEKGRKNLIFKTETCYEISYGEKEFDIAIARGLLHHLTRPKEAIAEMFRVADQILVIEPNGYNPVLKIIEKLSLYHRQHLEKSYFPSKISQWINSAGARMESENFVGLVPFFCPDWLALSLKKIEPWVEKSLFRKFACAVYIIKACR